MSQFPNQPEGEPTPLYPQPGNSMATAALVVGIVSLGIYAFNFVVPFLEVIVGIVGIVLAVQASKQGYRGGKRTAGLVCSIIAVALGGVWWTVCSLCAIPFMLF